MLIESSRNAKSKQSFETTIVMVYYLNHNIIYSKIEDLQFQLEEEVLSKEDIMVS